MARGIALPFRASSTGGIALIDGDEQASKIVLSGLSSGDNDNAFNQDIGIGVDFIFSSNDAGTRSVIMARISELFENFEKRKRFKLIRDTIQWRRGAEGEQILSFQYRNLESDEVLTFSRTFGGTT